ncbi:MAG: hypothetical protein HY735_14370 [Verrucomicrobia bacterium]|nr:hypothetical protein [Verrucomicrobiota bacterium]
MNTVSEGWDTARKAAEQRRDDQIERGKTLATQATRWFDRVKEFRSAADQFMVLQTPSETDRRLHRAYLAQIIAAGEELAILCRVQDLAPNSPGITLEAIEAELELLHGTLAGEHYLSATQRQAILAEVFEHGAQSKA